MIIATAVANLLLGLLYVGFGLITIAQLRQSWSTRGPSPFAMAWTTIFLTCGPHHLEHGLHVLLDGTAGSADLVTVLFGLPPGVAFLLMRTEELRGGPGDRRLPVGLGNGVVPLYLTALVGLVAVNAALVAVNDVVIGWALAPNLALFALYVAIAVVAGTTQLHNRDVQGSWSLSGLSLTGVFASCAAMHAAWMVYVTLGVYTVHGHLLVVDVLGVPAAAYFLWVVRGLGRGSVDDWNRAATPIARVAPAGLDPRAELVDA